MRQLIVSVLMVTALGSTAYAADGSSGCGPGWFILKDNSLVSSFLRSITNGLFFPTTTVGMTVGTSNCTRHKIVQTEQESLHFATQNYFEILAEASRGQGKTLAAFSDTIGCPTSARALFAEKFQKNYMQIYSSSQVGPETVLQEVYRFILSDETLTRACSLQLS
ncbi:MAG: DUF3015 family protein [Bdellovibrionales bacterium]